MSSSLTEAEGGQLELEIISSLDNTPVKYDPVELPDAPGILSLEIEKGPEFPRLEYDHAANKLSKEIKPGDFIRWRGYSNIELAFLHERHTALGGQLSLEQFIDEYRQPINARNEYDVVRKVVDNRLPEEIKKRLEEMEKHGFKTPGKFKIWLRNLMNILKKRGFDNWKIEPWDLFPVVVNAYALAINGQEDFFRADPSVRYSLRYWYGGQSTHPYYIQRVERVQKNEALAHLLDKIKSYLGRVDELGEDEDELPRLKACIEARKAMRYAEIYLALRDSTDPITTLDRLGEYTTPPSTGYFVLMPKELCMTRLQSPRLIFVNNEGGIPVTENRAAEFAMLHLPTLFAPDYSKGSRYVAFGVPNIALPLVEGLKSLILTIPAVEEGKIISSAPERVGLERFLFDAMGL